MKAEAKIADTQASQDWLTSLPEGSNDTEKASGEDSFFPPVRSAQGEMAAQELNLKSQTVTTPSTTANITNSIESLPSK